MRWTLRWWLSCAAMSAADQALPPTFPPDPVLDTPGLLPCATATTPLPCPPTASLPSPRELLHSAAASALLALLRLPGRRDSPSSTYVYAPLAIAFMLCWVHSRKEQCTGVGRFYRRALLG